LLEELLNKTGQDLLGIREPDIKKPRALF
jgi:hypothetical protein